MRRKDAIRLAGKGTTPSIEKRERAETGEERRSSGSREAGRAGVLTPFFRGNGREPIVQAKFGMGRTEKRCY